MTTYSCEGEPVEMEIATLEEKRDGELVRVQNMEDLTKFIISGGWVSVADFEREHGVKASELVGKWWGCIGGRLYFG